MPFFTLPQQKSKTKKITITKLNKLKLELQSGKKTEIKLELISLKKLH